MHASPTLCLAGLVLVRLLTFASANAADLQAPEEISTTREMQREQAAQAQLHAMTRQRPFPLLNPSTTPAAVEDAQTAPASATAERTITELDTSRQQRKRPQYVAATAPTTYRVVPTTVAQPDNVSIPPHVANSEANTHDNKLLSNDVFALLPTANASDRTSVTNAQLPRSNGALAAASTGNTQTSSNPAGANASYDNNSVAAASMGNAQISSNPTGANASYDNNPVAAASMGNAQTSSNPAGANAPYGNNPIVAASMGNAQTSSNPAGANASYGNNPIVAASMGNAQTSSNPTGANAPYDNNSVAAASMGNAQISSNPTGANATYDNNSVAAASMGNAQTSSNPTGANASYGNNPIVAASTGNAQTSSNPTGANASYGNNPVAAASTGNAQTSSNPTGANASYGNNPIVAASTGNAPISSNPTGANASYDNNPVVAASMGNAQTNNPAGANAPYDNNPVAAASTGNIQTSSNPTGVNAPYDNNPVVAASMGNAQTNNPAGANAPYDNNPVAAASTGNIQTSSNPTGVNAPYDNNPVAAASMGNIQTGSNPTGANTSYDNNPVAAASTGNAQTNNNPAGANTPYDNNPVAAAPMGNAQTSSNSTDTNAPDGNSMVTNASQISTNSDLANTAAPTNLSSPTSATLHQPITSTITLAQMGQPAGLTLTGGQLQSGMTFTIPNDQVITHAQLNLSMQVSSALAAQNATLQLTLNGQPLGSLPLGSATSDISDYQLDIPATMVVAVNNLNVAVSNADQLLCERDSATKYRLTILPKSKLILEGQELNIGNSLRRFPRPFFDDQRMTPADITFAFAQPLIPEAISAAVTLASWFGLQANYHGIATAVTVGSLPEKNGILFGHPGDRFGSFALPNAAGPWLQLIDNPANPVNKLLLVVGNNETELQQAVWRLISQPFTTDATTLAPAPQKIPLRQPYDAPRWINTQRPVRLQTLLGPNQTLDSRGISHDAIRINFRAAPDLFLWDGDTLPLEISYRFPTESWLDEQHSYLSASLNGNFLANLSINKQGLLENLWRRLGGDARQEHYQLRLDPWMIFGDNQLALYFNIQPNDDAPCSVLQNSNLRSQIGEDSTIDLSHTSHFAQLPNLAYFVGAAFPFSRLADYSQTILLLPPQPRAAEITALLDLAERAGGATGVALINNRVVLGIPTAGTNWDRLQNNDVLAVTTTQQTAFTNALLAHSPFEPSSTLLTIRRPTQQEKLLDLLTGYWFDQRDEADRFLASNEAWHGFISYRSPWNRTRDHVVIVALATSDDQLLKLDQDLSLPAINAAIRGDIAIVTAQGEVQSYRIARPFARGELPWHKKVIWYASQHAGLLALLALLLAIPLGLSLWEQLRQHARRRLERQIRPREEDKP